MLAHVGGCLRFASQPDEIDYINGHGEVLLVAKLRDVALKSECLRRILQASEKKPLIKLSVYTKRRSLAGAKQFGQCRSDTASRFNVWKQPGLDEIPVDAFVLIWVPCKSRNASASGSSSQAVVVHSNMGESSGRQRFA